MALDEIRMTVSDLKRTKNRVIGNPVAKEALVKDERFMRRSVSIRLCDSIGGGCREVVLDEMRLNSRVDL